MVGLLVVLVVLGVFVLLIVVAAVVLAVVGVVVDVELCCCLGIYAGFRPGKLWSGLTFV